MSGTARAALWMSGAICSFTVMAIAGRAVTLTHSTFEVMLYRSLLGVVIVVLVAGVAGTLPEVRSRRLGLHFLRNAAHFTGQNLWFFAIPLIPLSQLFALEFTSPLWVMVLSLPLLGERITRANVLAAGIGFIGVLLVTRPFGQPLSPGLIAAAMAAIFFAFTAIFTRRLTRDQSITCILFWLTVMQAGFGLIFTLSDGAITLPTQETAPWLALIGVAGLSAHLCMTKALSNAPPATVMPMDFLRLPVIVVVGALIYAEAVDPMVLLGGAIIFGANYVNLRRPRAARPLNVSKM